MARRETETDRERQRDRESQSQRDGNSRTMRRGKKGGGLLLIFQPDRRRHVGANTSHPVTSTVISHDLLTSHVTTM